MPAISLYVHWPFCLAKCPYCDFNSHIAQDIDAIKWRDALIRDLEMQIRTAYEHLSVAEGQLCLTSIFFGGGTPSLMPPFIIADLLDRAADLCITASNLEITAEANPTSAETAKLQGFSQAGINRLSLGIQSWRMTG